MANDGVDYKKKYMDLRARFIEALDVAFRTGYEQGSNEAQVQAQAQQAQMMAQQVQMAAQAPQQLPPGRGEEQQAPGQPDEVDAAIAELEGLVSKSEPSISDLKKSIESIKMSRMMKKLSAETKQAASKMGASRPFSSSFTLNLPEESKQAVNMQTKIVDDILAKWEDESKASSRDITQLLGTEALSKKED